VYGWLWRHLPGPWPARAALATVLAAAVVVVLFLVVFPWLEPRLPFTSSGTVPPASPTATTGGAGPR
jgi:hypothetical protein